MSVRQKLAEAIANDPSEFMRVVEKYDGDLTRTGAVEEAIAPYGVTATREDAVAVIQEINLALQDDREDLTDDELESVSGGGWFKNVWNSFKDNLIDNPAFKKPREGIKWEIST